MDTKQKNRKKENETGNEAEENGIFARFRAALKRRSEEEGSGTLSLILDVCAFLFSYLLATVHLAFGSYPLAVGWLATLPSRVWISLFGAVIGAVTLGRDGLIYAVVCLLVVLLRIVISGGEKRPNGERIPLFSEGTFLRASAALIGGFVLFAYALLMQGLTLASVAFGVFSVLMPAVLSFVLSGLFEGTVGVREFLFGRENFFAVLSSGLPMPEKKRKSKTERSDDAAENQKSIPKRSDTATPLSILRFSLALAAVVFLFAYSQHRIEFFGIRLSFVAAALATLFFAKRFGAFYGAAAGFFASIGLSATLSFSYVLAGLCAGALFAVGEAFALVLGGAVLSAFAGYAGGVTGLLSVLPEYALAAAVFYPISGSLPKALQKEEEKDRNQPASEMAGTMFLAKKSRRQDASEPFSEALSALAVPLKLFSEKDLDRLADDFDLLSSILSEMRKQNERAWQPNKQIAENLAEGLKSLGIPDPEVRVYGTRRPWVIAAGADKNAELFSRAELPSLLSAALSGNAEKPDFYRKGETVLLETRAALNYSVTVGSASAPGNSGEVSGDSFTSLTTEDGMFYAILSDGEGSGEEAKKTSSFAVTFLSETLSRGVTVAGALKLLNRILRRREEQCSATVDLFSFDLVTGEAALYKSGAAASFIKRKNRLFRLRSETLPLGLLAAMDAEKIRAELSDGDLVIMATDGVSPLPDLSPKMLDILGRPTAKSPEDYAAFLLGSAKAAEDRANAEALASIVSEAEKNGPEKTSEPSRADGISASEGKSFLFEQEAESRTVTAPDDMTVIVIGIQKRDS